MELEAGDSGVRSLVSVQGSLAMFAIWRWGSEEQKQRWLPGMHEGDAIGCFGLTEPDAGSDPGVDAHHREARRLRLGPERLEDVDHERHHRRRRGRVGAHRRRAISGFLVERGTPGFEAPEMKHKLSLRASVTSELVLKTCACPRRAAFPRSSSLRGPLRA